MPTIDTNTLSVRAVAETVFGTTPDSPTLQALRLTSDSLIPTKEHITSQTIRNDAMVDSIIRTLISQGGSLGFEMAYGTEFETFLPGLMRSTITSAFEGPAATVTVASATPGPGQATITGSGTTFATTFGDDEAIGAYVQVWDDAAGTPVSHGVGKIVSISETVIVVTDANDTMTDLTGGGNEQVDIRYIRNGTTLKSYTIEEQVTDDAAAPTDYFAVSTGVRVGGLNMTINAQGLWTCEWQFSGLDLNPAAAAIGTSTVTPVQTTRPLAASGDVNQVWEGNVYNNCMTEFSASINNNPRVGAVVGQLTPKKIGLGRFEPTGNVTFLKGDNVLLAKLRDHTSTSIDVIGTDSDGNYVIFTVPQVRYLDGGDQKPAVDDDVTFSSGWGAELSTAVGDYPTTPGAMAQWSLLPATPLA